MATLDPESPLSAPTAPLVADWTRWLRGVEKPLFIGLQDSRTSDSYKEAISGVFRSVAASRALVEERARALIAGLRAVPQAQATRRGVSPTGQRVNEWREAARAALALTEEEMLKRLEVK